MGYISAHPDLDLTYAAGPGDSWATSTLTVDTDASLSLPRSQTGVLIYIKTTSGALLPLDWCSRNQKLTVTSSCAAETVAAHEGITQVIPITPCFANAPATHRTDNSALLHNIGRGYTERLCFLNRSLRLRTGMIHDINSQGIVRSQHVRTDDNLADHLTKVLQRLKHQAAVERIALTRSIAPSAPPQHDDLAALLEEATLLDNQPTN